MRHLEHPVFAGFRTIASADPILIAVTIGRSPGSLNPLPMLAKHSNGWYFQLAAEFGDDLAAAETFARYFDEVRLQRPGDGECFNLGAGAQQGDRGRWWAVAVPREIGHWGEPPKKLRE
jgi:hypothetical protein